MNLHETSQREKKIPLYFVNGIVFVWNNSDVMSLRKNHRIVGNLAGCLPRAPRQNIHLGLPLQLAPYEATLLVEKGIAELVQSEKLSSEFDEDKVKEFKDLRQKSYEEQIPLFIADRRKEITQHRHLIVEGKKIKRRKLKQQEGDAKQDGDTECDDEAEFNVDEIEIQPIRPDQAVVQLFTESPWVSKNTLPYKDWLYPETEMEQLRYSVFKDLWEQEYFLTSGTKFGGDFLVYPGDPAIYHSFYIAVCVPQNQNLTAIEIVTLGRLGASVRKTVILCSVLEDKVFHTSIQWTGIT